jgi:O-antigen/teichoic acid export membrane protein
MMKNAFRAGMLFTAIGQYSNILIQLLINVILSRIISVEEFGVMANVQVFLLFFQMLVTAGLGPAIIQNKELSTKDYGVLFNYTIIFSIILSLFFGSFGFIVANVYHNPIYKKLFWIMATIVFCEGLNVVPTALLNKELRFRTLNLRLLFCNLMGAILGVIAAFSGLGVYALIISVAVPAVLTLFANFAVVRIRYTLSLERKPLMLVWGFARNQLSFTILNYFSRNSDNLMIGKFLGSVPLANYQKSYQLITMPNTVFLGIISPVLQPVLSQHQDNVALVRNMFFKIIRILGLIAFPLTAFMVLNAHEIIIFLFGPKWYEAVVPFSILSFSVWAQMLTSVTGSIFMARDHSHTLLKNGLISTAIIVPLTVIGILFSSITYVAIFICSAYVLNFFTSYWILMNKVLEGRLLDALKQLIIPACIGGIITVELVIMNSFLSFSSMFLTLVVRGIIWVLSLIICFYIFDEWKNIKQLFFEEEK